MIEKAESLLVPLGLNGRSNNLASMRPQVLATGPCACNKPDPGGNTVVEGVTSSEHHDGKNVQATG